MCLLHFYIVIETLNINNRARELMRSRIACIQLLSQLANLIMCIIVMIFQEGVSHIPSMANLGEKMNIYALFSCILG